MSFTWKHSGILIVPSHTVESVLGTDIFDFNIYMSTIEGRPSKFRLQDELYQKQFRISKKSIAKPQIDRTKKSLKLQEKLQSYDPIRIATQLFYKWNIDNFNIHEAKFENAYINPQNHMFVVLILNVDFQFSCKSLTNVIGSYKTVYSLSFELPYIVGDYSVFKHNMDRKKLPETIQQEIILSYENITIYEHSFTNSTTLVNPGYLFHNINYNPHVADIIMSNFIDKVILTKKLQKHKQKQKQAITIKQPTKTVGRPLLFSQQLKSHVKSRKQRMDMNKNIEKLLLGS